MSEILDVLKFHLKFKQIVGNDPQHMTKRKAAERANFLFEEVSEFADAAGLSPYIMDDGKLRFIPVVGKDQNLELQADALIDIVYVAKGTAIMLGLRRVWKMLWKDVQRANISKELGVTPRAIANPGQYLMDVGKPEGWEPPETNVILYDGGYFRSYFTDEQGVVTDDRCVEDGVYRT